MRIKTTAKKNIENLGSKYLPQISIIIPSNSLIFVKLPTKKRKHIQGQSFWTSINWRI
jgi:hypothetical protein